tara:strand:+ start:355 stop:591 length:237 start_codon:yes stop_codon:yes gene_type:complete
MQVGFNLVDSNRDTVHWINIERGGCKGGRQHKKQGNLNSKAINDKKNHLSTTTLLLIQQLMAAFYIPNQKGGWATIEN